MHNDRVTGRRMALLLASAALTVSGCSGSGSSTASSGPSGSTGTTATSPTPTAPSSGSPPTTSSSPPIPRDTIKVPHGTKLTPEGTRLRLGKVATVAWQPDQKTVGVIKVAVTRLQQVRMTAFRDWRLDAQTRRSTPYFVHATVTNAGRSDLSHVAVPLYVLDHHHTLLQASTFRASFKACPSRPLPKHFVRGKRTTVCLVYFVARHGRLAAVAFRPSQDVNAITWRGHVFAPPKH